MKTKKRLFAVWAVCLLALACGALFACSKSDVKVTEFNVAETATAQVNSYYAVPSVTASLSDGSKLPAEATVTDSAGTAVTLTNGRFYVSDLNGYTIVYRVVLDGKTLAEKRTALTVVDESLPEIAVLLPANKVVRTGTAYTIDESKISVDEGTALSYAVTRGETSVDFDEENKRFTVSEEGRYDITITATRDGRSSSEVYSVYGVNRGDDVFADFEYETDLAYFESRGGDYDVDISRNTDPAFVHSGTGSLKVTSTGNNYPTVLVTSDSNLNVRGGVTLSMWLYLDVPAGYEYTDQLFVDIMYGSGQWGRRPAGIDGYGTNKPGEWIYFTMGLEDGYSLSTMNFYLAVQGTTVTPVSPQVSLYIDDIRIEPYLDGDKTYFVTGSTFDLADMATAFCDGNGVAYPTDELTVTDASGEPADVTDGVLAFPEEGNYEYRVAHPAVDEYVSIVRRDVTLADGIIEYAMTGAYDVGLFDASVAVKYTTTGGYDGRYPALQKEWNAGTDFTVAFAEDLGIDFARGATVTFDTYLIGTGDAEGYTVALQKAGEEEQVLYTHEGNVPYTKKSLSFTVPAGGSITDYTLHVTMGKGWGWLLYNVKIAMDDAYAVGDGNVVVPADTETYDLSQISVYDAQTGEETDAAVRWKVFDGAGGECALTGTTLTLTENVYTVQATVGGERHTFRLARHTAEALDTAKTEYTYAFLGKEENAYQTALFDSTLPLAYGSSSYNGYTDIKVNNKNEKPYAMQLATMNWNPLDLTITLKSDAGIPTDAARTLKFDLYLVGTNGASTFSITATSAAGDEVFTKAYTGWTVNGTISMEIPAGVSLAGLQLHFISGSSSYFYINDFVVTVPGRIVEEFEVPATAEVNVDEKCTVPQLSAVMADGSTIAAEVTVYDSTEATVTLDGDNAFTATDLAGYTVVYRVLAADGAVLAEKETKITVIDVTAPVLASEIASGTIRQTGSPYVVDESKLTVDGQAVGDCADVTLTYTVVRDGDTTVAFDPETKSFAMDEAGEYTLTVTAHRGAKASEPVVVTVYGVNRGDDVLTDFEYAWDDRFFVAETGGNASVAVLNTDPAYAHTGSGSLKVVSTGNNYPRLKLASTGNLNVAPGRVLSMWVRLDVKEGYPYTDKVFVAYGYGGEHAVSGIDGYTNNKLGQWINLKITVREESPLTGLYLYFAVRTDPAAPVSAQDVALYIDDVRLEPYLEGETAYFVTGDTFDLADMTTTFYDGNGAAYPADELIVTDAAGAPADVTGGVITFPAVGDCEYRVTHPDCGDGVYVSVVRRDVTPVDGYIPYGLRGAYDLALFETAGAAVTVSGTRLQKAYNAGQAFTVRFADDLGIDFTEERTVSFTTYVHGTGDATGYTVWLQKDGVDAEKLYEHSGNVGWTTKALSFTVPAGGNITDYTLRVTLGGAWAWEMYSIRISADSRYALENAETVVTGASTYDLSGFTAVDAGGDTPVEGATYTYTVYDAAGGRCDTDNAVVTLGDNGWYTVYVTVAVGAYKESHTVSLFKHTAATSDNTTYTYAFLGLKENEDELNLFDSTAPLAYGSSSYSGYTDIKVNNYNEKPYAMQLATMNWNSLDLTITLKSDAGIPTDAARTLAFDLYLVGKSGASTFSITATSAAGDEIFTKAYTGWTVNGTISMEIPAGVSLAGLQLHFISGSSSYFYINDFVVTVQAGEAA